VTARPGFHFTAPVGHLNDPLGVTWHEDAGAGRYELFFQYNPDAPEWAVACRWGQVSGPDLVRWGPPVTALAPGPGEAGCWSGSVVVDHDGHPVIAYTRVASDALDVGSVVLAHGDRSWRGWTADDDPVLPGPPGADVVQFRDPLVVREESGWRMVIGGGRADGAAAAWLYRSPDLRSWRLEGVLAERSVREAEPVWTGSAWECVQLIDVDGAWVLVVSVWAGEPRFVVCGVGTFDGNGFTARAWQRLDATDVPYATTTFRDAVGRPCALSWLREPGPVGTAWAGALSLPWLLAVRDDRVVLAPHPDVATLRAGRFATVDGPGEAGPFPPHLDVEVVLDPASRGCLELVGDGGRLLAVELETGAASTRLRVPGRDDVALRQPSDSAPRMRLFLDAGLVEVITDAGDVASLRLPAPGSVRVRVSAGAAVTVHRMPAGVA
jgi:beta-fructofuranosidase